MAIPDVSVVPDPIKNSIVIKDPELVMSRKVDSSVQIKDADIKIRIDLSNIEKITQPKAEQCPDLTVTTIIPS